MPERETEKLYRLVTKEIWCERRYELVDELISEEYVDHIEQPGVEGTGTARYLASVRLMHSAFSDYHEEVEFVVADADRAAAYVRVTGRHDGDLMGIAPTGHKVDVRTMGILRFADGQVVERWGVGDSLTLMRQLGVVS
jgi:predicted ester cyclase